MLGFFEKRNIDPAETLAQSLGKLELPTFQGATLRALDLLRDPESSVREIATSIETNPGLVTHVLRVVNSAAYGLRQRVDRVSHAISLLGRSQIESLVVASAVKGGIKAAAPKTAGRRFWQGAAVRASLARAIAEMVDPPSQSQAFVTGLLQDMALPLLFSTRAKEYRPLVQACAADPTKDLAVLEKETFGWDHSIVGASVADHWDLPMPLTNGIGEHHLGEASVAVQLVSRVRDTPSGPDASELSRVAEAEFNIAPDTMQTAFERAATEASELVQLLT